MFLDADAIKAIIQSEPDNEKFDLVALTHQQPVLLVFLRHFGCTFCREALSDISKSKKKIDELGVKIVCVHMVDKETAQLHLGLNNLDDSLHISDPNRKLYDFFGLKQGSFRQLYGLNVMMRGLKAGMIEGHGHGFKFIGDGEQMPGLFFLQEGKVIRKFIHEYASDRPDYIEFTELGLARINGDT